MAAAAGAGTAAAPPIGIAAPPIVAPTRLGANPSATTVTRSVGAVAATDPDEFSLPTDSPVIAAFPFLQWIRPPAAGHVRNAMSELQGICITACSFDLGDHVLAGVLRTANLIESGLSAAACSVILHELHDARLLENSYQSEGEFWEALCVNPLVNRAALACQSSWVESYDPFDQPGVAAIPAVPAAAARRGRPQAQPAVPAVHAVPPTSGPRVLKFLQLTTWFAILSEGSRQLPGMEPRLLGRAHALLSHRVRDSTRREDSADIQSIAITLATYIGAWAGVGAGATPQQLARQTPSHLASCMSVVPGDLAGACGTATACEAELRDGQTLLRGRESEAVSVLWARIHNHLDRFPVIDQFSGRLPTSGATKDLLERLMIGMQIPAGSPLVRTWELARDLERKGKTQTVRDLFAAGSSVSQVVEEILDSHVTTAGAAAVPDSGTNEAGGVLSASVAFSNSGSMEQREFERAVTAPNFIAAYEAMKGGEGFDVIDAAATAGSVLMLRFLFASPAWMRPRHAAFDLLGKRLADRPGYLAYCVTLSADDGMVPKHYSTYRLPDAQSDLFWGCKWSELDMVNADPQSKHEGGFLALRYLENGTQYSAVVKSDFYTVESSLLGVREWFNRLLLGVGFSPAPGEGYSWTDVVDRQLELVRYFNGLPSTEKSEWQSWAGENFRRHALGRAEVLFKAKLVTSRPADETVSCFLPDGAEFFVNITSKLEDARPIAVVRRAFPSYFPSEPVVLPGTAPVHPRGGGGGSSSSGGGGPSSGAGAAGKTSKGKKREGGDAPGSKSDLAKVLKDGKLFIASRVGDVNAVASSLKVKADSLCWPVLFSTKKGDAALALCPCPDKHGGRSSQWHKAPAGFDRDKLFKKHFSAASAEQLKEAGWRNVKKAKI